MINNLDYIIETRYMDEDGKTVEGLATRLPASVGDEIVLVIESCGHVLGTKTYEVTKRIWTYVAYDEANRLGTALTAQLGIFVKEKAPVPTMACEKCGVGVPLDDPRFLCCSEHTREFNLRNGLCFACANKLHPEEFRY